VYCFEPAASCNYNNGRRAAKAAFSAAAAAGSTPVTRTIKETSFVYQDKRGFSCFLGLKYAKILKTGAEAVVETVSAPVFCFAESKMTGYFLGFFAQQRDRQTYG